MLLSMESNGQCSPSANISFPSCVITNTNINLSYNDPLDPNPAILNWQINGITPSGSSGSNNINYNFNSSGTYLIEISGYSIVCNNPITLSTQIIVNNAPFNISSIPINNPCEGQEISLEDYIDSSNVFLSPIQYEFSISGNIIPNEYTLPSGITTIDVFATDAAGCTASTIMNINATPNSIPNTNFTILDPQGNSNIINSWVKREVY